MTIRSRLLLLSFLVGVGIVTVTVLFTSAIASIDAIDREKTQLVLLADAVRDLSIAVNSLDSNQYQSVSRRFAESRVRAEKAFAAVAEAQVIPRISEELRTAFEVIGNMHALITEDLKALVDQFASFQPELETYFLESRSTSVRMFYTNERARKNNDLGAIYDRLEALVTSINGMTETLSGVSDTIQSQTEVINEETGKIRQQSLAAALSLSSVILVVIVGLSLYLGTSVSRRVKSLQTGLVPVTQGDFSRKLTVRGSDEVAGITSRVNELLDALNRLLREVQKEVESLDAMGTDLTGRMGEATAAVDQIQGHLGSSRDELASQTKAVGVTLGSASRLETVTARLTDSVRRQLEILGSSSAGIEQIIANISSVDTSIRKAEGASQLLQTVAREGQTKLNLVAGSVEVISRSSENLVQVTAIINDIADKTNLLAMNASIEAAHAGNAGRGFGVVASEIRKLAEEAGSQAREISKDLGIVGQNIGSIRSATREAVDVFSRILTQVGLVMTIVQEVQHSMAEQNTGGSLVLEGIRNLNDINRQVEGSLAGMKDGEVEILAEVRGLAEQNQRVNEHNQSVDRRVKEISETIVLTGSLAEATRRQIATLKAETGRFTTSEAVTPLD